MWESQWRDALLHACLEQIAQEVEARTYEAFVLFAVRGLAAAEVAEQLGMTQNSVFLSKRRILARMREFVSQMEQEL